MNQVRTFWVRYGGNLGDEFTRFLLRDKFGLEAVHAPAPFARLAGCGSIIQELPPAYSGMVLGSGLMWDKPWRLPHASILAVRGHLTAERMGLKSALMGDLGLLASDYAFGVCRDIPMGYVPHLADVDMKERASRDGRAALVHLGSPDIIGTIKLMARCHRIVTSSLHGIIVADALGIPREWRPSPRVLGNGFKFRDYASSYGGQIVPGELGCAPRDRIDELRDNIRTALDQAVEQIRCELTHETRSQ